MVKDDIINNSYEVLKELVMAKQVTAFKYYDEYYPLDTLYDKDHLDRLWNTDKAYWKIWS